MDKLRKEKEYEQNKKQPKNKMEAHIQNRIPNVTGGSSVKLYPAFIYQQIQPYERR